MPKKTRSKLLTDESPLQLLPSLAVALNGRSGKGGNRNGDRKAVFLQQVYYWLNQAEKSNGKLGRFKDSRWWIYNSIGEWQRDNFPMWSEDTIKRIINDLVDDGVLLRDQDGSGRPTKSWFSIDPDRLNALVGNGRTLLPILTGMEAQCPEPGAQRPQLEGTRDYQKNTITDNPAALAAVWLMPRQTERARSFHPQLLTRLP
jgi:hypothetical protein